jgi:hypothetical protein
VRGGAGGAWVVASRGTAAGREGRGGGKHAPGERGPSPCMHPAASEQGRAGARIPGPSLPPPSPTLTCSPPCPGGAYPPPRPPNARRRRPAPWGGPAPPGGLGRQRSCVPGVPAAAASPAARRAWLLSGFACGRLQTFAFADGSRWLQQYDISGPLAEGAPPAQRSGSSTGSGLNCWRKTELASPEGWCGNSAAAPAEPLVRRPGRPATDACEVF